MHTLGKFRLSVTGAEKPLNLQGLSATAVAELARVGGFEGVLTWALGLPGEQGFAVSMLDDPPTLVVDVLHP